MFSSFETMTNKRTSFVSISGSRSATERWRYLQESISMRKPVHPYAQKPTAEPVQTTAVIILTYMRSGSSLTGDILQQAPGVFYLYEPLHYLGRALAVKENVTFVNGTVRSVVCLLFNSLPRDRFSGSVEYLSN